MGADLVFLLQVLDLHDNQLTALPEDIGQLTALQVRPQKQKAHLDVEVINCSPCPFAVKTPGGPRCCSLGCGRPPPCLGACSFGDFTMSFHSFAGKEGPARAPFKMLSWALTRAPFQSWSPALHLLSAHCARHRDARHREHSRCCLSVSLLVRRCF